MSNSPLMSVAMATYNGERFLREQLDSILGQDYGNFELIISDDCSTDNTIAIIKEYLENDTRIRMFTNNDRLGYVGNFERAIIECKGEIIFLADQDDVWRSEKITALSSALGDALLIHSDAELVDSQGKTLAASYNEIKKVYYGDDAFGALLNGNYITGCTIAFKKNLLKDALPFPRVLPHDYWLALIASTAGGVRAYRGVLTKYRQHSSNVFGAGLEPIESKKDSSRTEKSQAKLAQARRKMSSISAVVKLLADRLTIAQARLARGLIDYYLSYPLKSLRFRALLFYCQHHNSIFPNIGYGDIARRAVSSIIGYRIESKLWHFSLPRCDRRHI